VIAQRDPTDTRFAGEVTPRPKSTTAILFRTGRFELVRVDKWFPFGVGFNPDRYSCGSRTDNSGYQTLRVKLWDKVAKKHVVAVSLRHWTWYDCSEKNMKEIFDGQADGENAHPGLGSAELQIVGGDYNGPALKDGEYRCWYRMTNHRLGGEACSGHANLGFADPLYESCNGDKRCFDNGPKIDFIFGRNGNGTPARTSHFKVIGYDEADRANIATAGADKLSNTVADQGFRDVNSNYSQHHAIRSYFFY
jgi:hypothetical protein